MSNVDVACVGVNIGQYFLTAAQVEGVLRIVSLILSILGTLVIVALKVIEWLKKAKEDGKITKDEIKEIVEDVKDDVVDIIDKTKEISENIKNDKKE